MWQIATGEAPWHGVSPAQVIQRVCANREALQFPTGLPPAYVELGRRCLAFERAERPTMAKVLAVSPIASLAAVEVPAATRPPLLPPLDRPTGAGGDDVIGRR